MKKSTAKKVQKTLRWVFVAILIALLILLLKEALDHIDILIRKVNEQQHTIGDLQSQLETAKQANAHLVDQWQLEHSKVQELQSQLQLKINGQPVQMEVPKGLAEEPQQKAPELHLGSPVIPVLVGVMAVLKELVFRVPAF